MINFLLPSAPAFSAAFVFCNASQRSFVKKYFASTNSIPLRLANCSAPAPTIITCFDFSMTMRARAIGLRTCSSSATAPAAKVFPSMIAASISFVPALVKYEPLPALKCGSSSSTRTAASTASRLEPPPCKTSRPARSAFSNPARYSCSFSGVILLRSIVPAPPMKRAAVEFIGPFFGRTILRLEPSSLMYANTHTEISVREIHPAEVVRLPPHPFRTQTLSGELRVGPAFVFEIPNVNFWGYYGGAVVTADNAVLGSLSGGLGSSEPSNLFALAFAKVAVAQRSNCDRGHAGGKRKLLSLAARFSAESSFAQTHSPKFFQLRRALAQRFASELRTRNPGRAWSAPGENSLC